MADVYLFLVLFITFVLAHSQTITKRNCFSCCNCGDVGPVDPYLIRGQKAVLWCQVDQSNNLTADRLYFLRGNDHFDYNSTISADKKRLNIEFDVGDPREYKGTYYCFVNTSSLPNLNLRSPVVGRQKVLVENKVKNVTDLKCRIYRPTEEMRCTWNFNNDSYYLDEKTIQVNFRAYSGIFYACPKMVNKRECFFNFAGSSNYVPVDVGKWKVFATVVNIMNNESTTTSLSFNSENVTLIEAVSNPKVHMDGNNCFLFSFDPLQGNIVQDALVKLSYHGKERIYKYEEHSLKSPPVCGILPFVHYKVAIQIKVSWFMLWGQSAYVDAFNPTISNSDSIKQTIWGLIRNGSLVVNAPIKYQPNLVPTVSRGYKVWCY
ncbi:hypothetical protein KUTeg_016159 [Tegillarca granosa]|uniref:Ig-like domain-containing protein n=1 Tax=Tegillarca granosa TaxID=220873 RepID=A0ABQ9EK15_TEGGR|nr:hypothetical protein KUTeg_016159 [Tegillarca granosa]